MNGTDITAALNNSKYKAYPSVAHTLQLVVKDGCVNHPKVANVITKAKKVVGNFKKSAKNTKILKTFQKQLNLPEHRLIQEEPTRWNTTYYMLKKTYGAKGRFGVNGRKARSYSTRGADFRRFQDDEGCCGNVGDFRDSNSSSEQGIFNHF